MEIIGYINLPHLDKQFTPQLANLLSTLSTRNFLLYVYIHDMFRKLWNWDALYL